MTDPRVPGDDTAPVPFGATPPTEGIPRTVPVSATAPLPQHPSGAEPVWAAPPHIPGSLSAAAGSHGYPQAAATPVATPRPAPTPTRRGPGWGAVILIAGLCTVLAGMGGGLLGGWLAASGSLGTHASSTAGAASAPTAGAGAVTRPAGSVANIAAKAMPSVVTIKIKGSSGSGTGSGWVLDNQGHIVTNNHVAALGANGGTITVVLSDGKQIPATIVGRDQSYDLAVLKVTRTDLAPLPVGDSAKVVVGDEVIAVGAPLGLNSTVTSGIVSALNRPVAAGDAQETSFINAIQTDAAINPGNSGGPLLNMSGEVIGVNSAIATAPSASGASGGGSIGVGFAIPSNQVAKTAQQLIKTGKAVHPIIGVYLDQKYDGEGVRIDDKGSSGSPAVNPDGPAGKAGLKAGDIIVAIDGRPVTETDALVVAIRAHDVGDKVTLTVRRGGKDSDLTMVLEASSN